MDDLTSELLRRIRERAADPDRRSEMSGYDPGYDGVPLLDALGGRPGSPLHHLMGQFAGMMKGFGVSQTPFRDKLGDYKPPALPPPATEADIAAAEAAIGRALPADLRRLYTEVADGEFGPGEGLFPLECMVEDYNEQIDTGPFGPQGQPWPTHLLPIAEGHYLDLDGGAVMGWNHEALLAQDPTAWDRAFKPVAESLSAWLEQWLNAPGGRKRMAAGAAQMEAQLNDGILPKDPARVAEGIAEMMEIFGRMSPAERAMYGLPETGWEAVARERYFGMP